MTNINTSNSYIQTPCIPNIGAVSVVLEFGILLLFIGISGPIRPILLESSSSAPTIPFAKFADVGILFGVPISLNSSETIQIQKCKKFRFFLFF